MALLHFADVQHFITSVMEENKKPGAPAPAAPHKAFWASLSYKEFTEGNVPGVLDPVTKLPIAILVKGNSKISNLILSLTGEGPLFDPRTGAFGPMPANGRQKFTADQIKELADWIDAGCPE